MKLRSAREAIHDAYATHLTSKGFEASFVSPAKKPDFGHFYRSVHSLNENRRERRISEFSPVGFYSGDRSDRSNNNASVCHAAEAGMVISTVENLPEPFKSWAKFAYGPRTQEFLPEQAQFFRWLENDVVENFENINRVYRKATKDKIRDVVAYAVLDYRSYSISERHLYPVSLVISRCGIIRQNWNRDFLPWHRYYWNLCDSFLDQTCLPPVAQIVKRLKWGKA